MFPKDRAYRPYFRQNSGMTDLFFFAWNQQQTHNYCTMRLILMLRSENMPDTYKMQVCWLNYTKMMLLFRRTSTMVSYKHGK